VKRDRIIEVVTGNLKDEEIDVICCGVDRLLRPVDGGTKALFEESGEEIMEELDGFHYSLEEGGCISSTPHETKAVYLVHVNAPEAIGKDAQKNLALLYQGILNALNKADKKLSCNNISIPGFAEALFRAHPTVYARIYFDAILAYYAQEELYGTVCGVNHIKLVNLDPEIGSALRDEFNYRFPLRKEDYDPEIGYCNSFSDDYSEESFSSCEIAELKKIQQIVNEEEKLDFNTTYPTSSHNISDIPEIRALRRKIERLEASAQA
jgi:O-acetyl-ADP-ribose deacetylase (regulator of RNase III)